MEDGVLYTSIENPVLSDYRIFLLQEESVPTTKQVSADSFTDFRLLESVLAIQIGGNVGDVLINGLPVSTQCPTPHKLSANVLNVEWTVAGTVCIYAPKKSECPVCSG